LLAERGTEKMARKETGPLWSEYCTMTVDSQTVLGCRQLEAMRSALGVACVYLRTEEQIHMVQLTETAVSKVQEILSAQEPKPAGLRIAVVGGGCSGFSYSMAFENAPGMLDKTYSFEGLKVFVDQASLLYLDGAEVDYVESIEGSGFKFNNPNVKSTCGCGSSFSA
jgi:iron-sulfur cluster assembly accessory protein